MPLHRCFACGPDNPHGLKLKFVYDEREKRAECIVKLAAKFQGATGYAHGGIIALLLDEAMAKVNGLAGRRAVTAKLQVTYRKLVPLQQTILLTGQLIRQSGRRLYLKARIVQKDVVLAEARGLFIRVEEINPSKGKDSRRSR